MMTLLNNSFSFDADTHTRVAYVLHELEISGHFNTGNIFIASPDVGVITDEDSGDEEGSP